MSHHHFQAPTLLPHLLRHCLRPRPAKLRGNAPWQILPFPLSRERSLGQRWSHKRLYRQWLRATACALYSGIGRGRAALVWGPLPWAHRCLRLDRKCFWFSVLPAKLARMRSVFLPARTVADPLGGSPGMCLGLGPLHSKFFFLLKGNEGKFPCWTERHTTVGGLEIGGFPTRVEGLLLACLDPCPGHRKMENTTFNLLCCKWHSTHPTCPWRATTSVDDSNLFCLRQAEKLVFLRLAAEVFLKKLLIATWKKNKQKKRKQKPSCDGKQQSFCAQSAFDRQKEGQNPLNHWGFSWTRKCLSSGRL